MNLIMVAYTIMFVAITIVIVHYAINTLWPKVEVEHEYYRQKFWYDFFMIFWHRRILGKKLRIDIIAKPKEFGGESNRHRTIEMWTPMTTADLRSGRDYKKIIGWKEGWIWAGVPCYIRMSNFSKFNNNVVDMNGKRIYPEETAGTLYDALHSGNLIQFIKGLAKLTMSKMDLQTLGLIALIAVGAIAGCYFMGVF